MSEAQEHSRLLYDNSREIQEVIYDASKGEEKSFSPDETFERSAALERVYVHEVYENFGDYSTYTVRSKVVQFLNNLDPGSIICDVGCGNGRYLASSCNPSIFALGCERSFSLAKAAKNSAIEVALCDNLELPFRDESFDGVLSLSVIHHFATTERRVRAIRELARILKVGGKVIISVWAFEQKSRRFDGNSSQDVLIPWQSPQMKNTGISDDEEEDDFLAPYHAYNYTEDSIHSNSSRSLGDGDSSSISSTSSPNDTCYSFVRRALQKLAGGKKSPWFLDSWTSSRDMQKENSLDAKDEDAKDLPIELRRLDDYSTVGIKSRSLGSILYPPQKQIVRSLSSVPSLGYVNGEKSGEHVAKGELRESVKKPSRPKLMKQKQSITDDSIDIMYHQHEHSDIKSQFLRKQSSLNEELMAESRIREKERIRKKIQKQMSLNESFLYRSLLTKRLQVIREGFTTRFKKSTGSLERLTKNGFVKIIKNIKSVNSTNDLNSSFVSSESREPIFSEDAQVSKSSPDPGNGKSRSYKHCEPFGKVRRESGSDSSKESSCDTSIESEDSFASVIHNPNPRSSLVPTSPLALSIQSPTNKAQQSCQKDTINFSFDFDKKETFLNGAQIVESKEIPCESSKNDVMNLSSDLKKNISFKGYQSLKFPNVKDLPEIPKFSKKLTSFPIVKRLPSTSSTKNIIVPKLVSLEIFNPEIDDSDSSDEEVSSPDSVDSVINISTGQTESLLTNVEIESKKEEKFDEKMNTSEKLTVKNFKSDGSLVFDFDNKESSAVNELSINDGNNLIETDDETSPPLSAKIQSHVSQNLLTTGSQASRHNFQFQQQQQKVNDFILEEENEEEIIDTHSMEISNNHASFKIYDNSNDTTCLLQESFDESDSIGGTLKRPLLRSLNSNFIRMNENSTESYNNSQENSNSTTASLDSPSIGGGSATHHVFHHIFRQNELDELINKHIENLHIVSSFYEKQSWCVVCEKVQVWTI